MNFGVLFAFVLVCTVQCQKFDRSVKEQNKTHAEKPAVVEVFSKEVLDEVCGQERLPEVKYRSSCCEHFSSAFARSWFAGGNYLTNLLTNLEKWSCDQFVEECENPTYDFNKFTNLVYDRFCQRHALLKKCTGELQQVVNSGKSDLTEGPFHVSGDGFSESNWNNMTESLVPSKMHFNDLIRPCVQIALFDRPSGGVGRFHEIVQPFTPFCEMTWTGYDIDTAMNRRVSPWTSMPLSCRANIAVCLTVISTVGVAIVAANIIVIVVFLTTPRLRNSQALFKISIAVGDLLIGLIVFPNILLFQYLMFLHPRPVGKVIKEEYAGSRLPQQDVTNQREFRRPGGGFSSIVSAGHLSSVGFFTTMSLLVSIYTLLAAGFDRYFAIYRPLKYTKNRAKVYAMYSCSVIWMLSISIALIPIFVRDIEYSLVAAIAVTSAGGAAIILLSVAMILPLIVLWSVTIATYRSAKKHARTRRTLRVAVKPGQNEKLERRLIKTLTLMVGVFSICLLPSLVSIAAVAFSNNIVFSLPKLMNPGGIKVYSSFSYCAYFILLTNSLWNCFIYSARAPDFRAVVKTGYARVTTFSLFTSISNGVRNLLTSARRFSESYFNYRTKSSSSGTCPGSSGMTMTSKSIDNSSVFVNDSSSFSNSPGDSVQMNTYYKSSDATNQEDFSSNDSIFGSFTVDAGADRFFVSVMENIEE